MLKRLFSLIFISSSLLVAQEEFEYNLSICSIFQNEAPYLKEWIMYHRSVGVEHFYLYNNNSTDNYLKQIECFIQEDYVTLIQWPSVQETNDWSHYSFQVQTGAYNNGIDKCRGVSKWLALIDIDEFIVPVSYDNIVQLLETDYPNVSGLCVNWQCYGTSFGASCPRNEDGSCSILNHLVWKMDTNNDHNKLSKSIVQPNHVSNCPNPHYCIYLNNHWHVDSKKNACDMCCSEVNVDKIRINHYWTRDILFLNNIKIPRYIKWGTDIDTVMQQANRMNSEYDPILSSLKN